MYGKGIGPQGLGVSKNNGYTIGEGSGCGCSPLHKTAAWTRKEGKDPKGGLNAKGVASYRRENPGSKLQTAVTKKPSELKRKDGSTSKRGLWDNIRENKGSGKKHTKAMLSEAKKIKAKTKK